MTEGEAEQGSSANPLAFDDDDEVHVLSDDDDDDDVCAPPPAKKAKKADDLPPRACRGGRASLRRLPAALHLGHGQPRTPQPRADDAICDCVG